jgi:hypothetical protein
MSAFLEVMEIGDRSLGNLYKVNNLPDRKFLHVGLEWRVKEMISHI